MYLCSRISFITQDVVDDLLEPKRRQPSPMQEPANILSRQALPFLWMPLHDNLLKDNNVVFAWDWPMSRNTSSSLRTLHPVCTWNRESERQNNWTPIPYKISTRTSGQTMLLQCLKWHFSLEWIQTNPNNSKQLQEQEVHANIISCPQILAKRIISALKLHFKAWAFKACSKTPFLWRNQRYQV